MLLASPTVEVLVYPSDVAISGQKEDLARARAAIADRLTHAPAYLTMSEEAEKVEDRLEVVAGSDAPLAERLEALKGIDSTLATLTIPFDEWETLYRERLQIERDILASALGTQSGPPGVPGASATTETEQVARRSKPGRVVWAAGRPSSRAPGRCSSASGSRNCSSGSSEAAAVAPEAPAIDNPIPDRGRQG